MLLNNNRGFKFFLINLYKSIKAKSTKNVPFTFVNHSARMLDGNMSQKSFTEIVAPIPKKVPNI